ncbi:MAG: serine hydrolase [Acidimicrobiales bacterium]
MIEISTNSAGQALFDHIGAAAAVQAWDDSLGMVETTVHGNWALSTTTPADQLTLLDAFVAPNSHLDDASRAYGLSLLGNVEPSQVFGLSPGPPPAGIRAAKTGRYPSLGVRNTIGWIQADGRSYLIATFCQREPSDQSGEAAMEAIASATWSKLSS